MTRFRTLRAAALLACLPVLPALAEESPPPPVQATRPPDPVPAVALTPPQVETVLRARGYDRLEGLERDGDQAFRLARAERFGVAVGPLRLDAATGQVIDEPPLTDAQVTGLLRQRGYSEVREIQPTDGALLARAVREGQEVALRIDPTSGVVRPAAAN